MSRIDRIRRTEILRRASKNEPDEAEEARDSGPVNLPVPVGRASTVPPRDNRPGGAAYFAAQLIGQDGERRGLRAGATAIDQAKASYNRAEWSGSKDRRARKGRITRTEA